MPHRVRALVILHFRIDFREDLQAAILRRNHAHHLASRETVTPVDQDIGAVAMCQWMLACCRMQGVSLRTCEAGFTKLHMTPFANGVVGHSGSDVSISS